ncbi:MAG: S8 family serine peptidase, partial [Actinomycetota bacterium]|nr:S8 family serine peptidase [Actinomycetota bacterium]
MATLAALILIGSASASARQAPQPTSERTSRSSPPAAEEFLEWGKAIRASTEFRAAASDRVVARFPSSRAARAAARREGWRIDSEIAPGAVTLRVPRGQRPTRFARHVAARPGVRYAEPDRRVRALAQSVDWGVEALGAPTAHAAGMTGDGVTVAVVDSGVDYRHRDLRTNIWTNPGEIAGNGVDDDGNGYVDDVRGWDFIGPFFTSVQEDNDPMDVLGHGTHVAGTVAAADNSIGVVGVAPDATIMPVKVLDDVGVGFDSTIAAGIRYAVDNGADIINMSLGGYQPSSLMREAVDYAEAASVTVVAAAGNEFFYSIPSYPAGFPHAVSVAAAARDRSKTWWSNWGNVDFLAPGEDIRSTTPDDRYDRYSGTSMAAPHVAGALAVLKEAHPGFGPAELEQALAVTARDVLMPGKDEVTGSGFPDISGAGAALPAVQLELYRDPHLIPSDGTRATITALLLNGGSAPLPGRTVAFSSDVGSVTPTDVTDARGRATAVLRVQDHFGVATVTAATSGRSRDIRIIVEDDRVRVDDAFVRPPQEEDDFFFSEGGGGATAIEPGQDVQVVVRLGNRRFGAPRRARTSYRILRDGNPVPGLAGTIEPVTVGFEAFGTWSSQTTVRSLLLRMPPDARGRHELRVQVTSEETGKRHSYSVPFWVGVRPQVLVVRDGFSFDAETLNYFDFDFQGRDWGYKDMLTALGRTFDVQEGYV